jgi:hypothetical protein
MTTPPVPSDTDRLAAIRAHFAAANVDVPLDAPMKERTERVSAGIRLMSSGREYTEFLLSLVDSLQGRLDTAEGQLAKWREIHQPERRYTPDDGETAYATYSEAADASFDGVGTPRSVTFFEICSHCASLEMAEGCEHDYRESLWPCKDAEAAGLGEGDGQ